MNRTMATTAFELEGFRTTKHVGIVRGITVRSRSIFGTVGASLQTLVGGKRGPGLFQKDPGVNFIDDQTNHSIRKIFAPF